MIRFNALGAPDLRGETAPEAASALSQPRVLALLAYLAIARPRGLHRRDSLVALFWPELDHDGARNALRQLVHRLRRAIGDDAISSRGSDEVGLAPERVRCDVVAFEEALDAGRHDDALALYRGDLLPGFFIGDAPAFERWLDEERSRLRRRAAECAAQLAERESADGRHPLAAQHARLAVELAGDDEAAVRRHITVLLRGGDRAGALKVYEAFERRMRDEFELAPSGETRALVAELPHAAPSSPIAPRGSPAAGLAATTAAPPAPTPAAPAPSMGVPATVERSRRRSRAAALGAVGIAASLLSLTVFTRERAPASAVSSEVRTLAVLPFAIRGSDELAYLGEGMIDLLSAKLNGAVGIRAIDPHAVMAGLDHDEGRPVRLEDGVDLARRIGAGWMITGQLVELAGRLEISASLYELRRTPRVVATADVAGETTDLFRLVDDLTGRILTGIAVGRDTSLLRLSAFTTHSLPALKAYLEGEQAMRAGLDARAASAFRVAVELDSTFALAQYRYAVAASWATSLGREGSTELAERAAARADRLTPLLRDLIRGYHAYRVASADVAERSYRDIVDSHPDNVEGWMMLGETLFHFNPSRGRASREGTAAFERVLELDPSNPHALIHLARQAALDGRVATLDSIHARYTQVHRDAERRLEIEALIAWTRDDPERRAAIAAAAPSVADVPFAGLMQAGLNYAENPNSRDDLLPSNRQTVRDLRLFRAPLLEFGEVDAGRGRLRTPPAAPLDAPDLMVWRLETEALMASLEVFAVPTERVEELRRRLRARSSYPALAATPGTARDGAAMREYLLGLLAARLGDTVAVRASIASLRRGSTGAASDAVSPHARSFALALEAETLRRRGDALGALAAVDSLVLDWQPIVALAHYGVRERFLRAELLRELGRDAEAVSAYDAMASAYDIAFMPLAHLRRAQLAERRGDRERARFHYGRFLRWWDAADPERQPLVAQARHALAALER